LSMGSTAGYMVNSLPGQDPNRRLFMVHDDKLYRIWFSPDDPHNSVSYTQMVNLYAMIVNTFTFTP
jgi:hypothetical protein